MKMGKKLAVHMREINQKSFFIYLFIYFLTRTNKDNSAGKGTCHQDWQPGPTRWRESPCPEFLIYA